MTPFKKKTNGTIKSIAIWLIILCVSEGSVGFLQAFTERASKNREFEKESRNSVSDRRQTLNMSSYIRDVRADSRQSRIDARDIRTDFKEIRTELRNAANKRDTRENADYFRRPERQLISEDFRQNRNIERSAREDTENDLVRRRASENRRDIREKLDKQRTSNEELENTFRSRNVLLNRETSSSRHDIKTSNDYSREPLRQLSENERGVRELIMESRNGKNVTRRQNSNRQRSDRRTEAGERDFERGHRITVPTREMKSARNENLQRSENSFSERGSNQERRDRQIVTRRDNISIARRELRDSTNDGRRDMNNRICSKRERAGEVLTGRVRLSSSEETTPKSERLNNLLARDQRRFRQRRNNRYSQERRSREDRRNIAARGDLGRFDDDINTKSNSYNKDRKNEENDQQRSFPEFREIRSSEEITLKSERLNNLLARDQRRFRQRRNIRYSQERRSREDRRNIAARDDLGRFDDDINTKSNSYNKERKNEEKSDQQRSFPEFREIREQRNFEHLVDLSRKLDNFNKEKSGDSTNNDLPSIRTMDNMKKPENPAILPQLNNNKNCLLYAMEAVLLAALLGQVYGSSSKNKLKWTNWQCFMAKQKVF